MSPSPTFASKPTTAATQTRRLRPRLELGTRNSQRNSQAEWGQHFSLVEYGRRPNTQGRASLPENIDFQVQKPKSNLNVDISEDRAGGLFISMQNQFGSNQSSPDHLMAIREQSATNTESI